MLGTGIKEKIISSLLPFNPSRIILFGSYAYGMNKKDSDIDLLVVINEDFLHDKPTALKAAKLKIRRALYEINKDYPIDLFVYTNPLYDRFMNKGSMFSKEIRQKGIVLYERSNERMA